MTMAITRSSNTEIKNYKNGALLETLNAASSAIPNDVFAIGYATPSGAPMTLKIGAMTIGSEIGFDHAAHNTNVRNYLGL